LRERGSSLAVARTVRLNPANDLGRFVAQSKSVSGGLQTGFRANHSGASPGCCRIACAMTAPAGRSFFN
jgi:hypothetical protein